MKMAMPALDGSTIQTAMSFARPQISIFGMVAFNRYFQRLSPERLTMPIRLFCCLLIASSVAAAAPSRVVPAFEVNAKVDKKNLLLHFDRGATASLLGKDTLDGIVGVTSDLAGGPVPAYIVFDASVTEQKLTGMSDFQGRLAGAVQCKRVRLGNSPLFPHLKVAVLAEGCTIESLNH